MAVGGGGALFSGTVFGVIAIGALIVWGLMGFYQIDQQERGVVLRFGKYYDTVQPGLQWNPPLIDEVTRVNTTKVRSASLREIMLTQDENIVEVRLSVQYVINDPVKFVLKVRDPERSLQPRCPECSAPCRRGNQHGSGADRRPCADCYRC